MGVTIAVAQHKLRATPAEDAEAFGAAARRARDAGAEIVIFPEVFALHEHGSSARERMLGLLDDADIGYLIPHVDPSLRGQYFEPAELEPIGRVSLPVGDAAVDPDALARLYAETPDAIIMAPRSESDLQAEAVLEVAIGLSESASGLVIVVDPAGAEPGSPGHGGSAVVLHGEVVAEAISDDELLVAEVPLPVPAPQPRERLPQVPTILLQRLAHHEGRKLDTGYLADLS